MCTDGTEKVSTSDQSDAKCLTLDVFGVAMLLPKEKKVALVDGRKGRIAIDGTSVIPPHVPFMGFEPGALTETGEPRPEIAFSYDVDGTGKRRSFECFLLNRHTVTFEGMLDNTAIIDDRKIPSMSRVVGKVELCPGVKDGSLEKVVATIDVRNARTVSGQDHGEDHAISFGGKVDNWAEKITAVFEVKDRPVIRLTPKNGNGNGDAVKPILIPLQGEGPWRVMIANIPPEEVLNITAMEPGQDVPLTHLELLYDFYHLGAGQKPQVPTCASHENGHHAVGQIHRVAGSGAHCGPPVSGP